MRFLTSYISVFLTPILIVGPLFAQAPAAAPSPPPGNATIEGLQMRLVEGDGTEAAINSRTQKGFLVEVTDSNGTAVPDAVVTLRLPDAAPSGTFSDGTHAAVAYTDQNGRVQISNILWGSTTGAVSIRATAAKGTAHAGILIQQTLTPAQIGVVAHPVVQTAAAQAPPPVTLRAAAPVTPPPSASAPPKIEVTVSGSPAAPAPQQPGNIPTRTESIARPTPAPAAEPAVSVVNAPGAEKTHSSKTKWIILAAVAAAAGGAGFAMMGKKSSSSSTTGTGISIGSPGISVGAPH